MNICFLYKQYYLEFFCVFIYAVGIQGVIPDFTDNTASLLISKIE